MHPVLHLVVYLQEQGHPAPRRVGDDDRRDWWTPRVHRHHWWRDALRHVTARRDRVAAPVSRDARVITARPAAHA